ncbi:MAG: hypothetical protein N3D84_00225 [Candidatus Woesearchaeota archaeon]|nr:hypothetical protein [Candidatus Woesearchaeota archaeon]
MYAHSGHHHAKADKPCDGFRYDVFHKNNDLIRHQLDINIFRPAIEHNLFVHKPTPSNEQSNGIEYNRKGHYPCKGRLYHLYHSMVEFFSKNTQKKDSNAPNHNPDPYTIDNKINDYGSYEKMNDARNEIKYESGSSANNQDIKQTYAFDKNSIDNAINFIFDSRRYSRIELEIEAMHLIRQYGSRGFKEEIKIYTNKDEKAHKSYGAEEGRTTKYIGRDIKKIKSIKGHKSIAQEGNNKNRLKPDEEEKAIKEKNTKLMLNKSKKKASFKGQHKIKDKTEATLSKNISNRVGISNKNKTKSEKKKVQKKKGVKYDISGHTLPSGHEVRKRPSPSNRKGKRS